MLKGVLVKESLQDEGVLGSLSVTSTTTEKVDNAAEGQPGVWTLASFEVADDVAADVARKISQSLKPGKWYVDFKDDTQVWIVFAGKVFNYKRGDAAGKQAVVDYARSLGIPESQLDW